METLGQCLGANIAIPGNLEICEKLLELVGNAIVFAPVDALVILIAVDVLSYFRTHEQSLDQTIHVAGCPLICQSNVRHRSLTFFKAINLLLDKLEFMDGVVLAVFRMWI